MNNKSRAISAAPCAKCPFRKDVPIYLHQGGREEIAEAFTNQQSFWCHETTVDDEDDGGGRHYAPGKTVGCAGAAKAIMQDGGTTQMMRISERLGLVDLDVVETKGANCWSLRDWVKLAEGSTGDNPEWEIPEYVETCSIVDPGCLAPAGYLSPSGAVQDGLEAADCVCTECGEPVCSNCLGGGDVCPNCAEELDQGWER